MFEYEKDIKKRFKDFSELYKQHTFKKFGYAKVFYQSINVTIFHLTMFEQEQ